MGFLLLLAVVAGSTPMTPEQEVDAWDPTAVDRAAAPPGRATPGEVSPRAELVQPSIGVPLAAVAIGAVSGLGTAVGVNFAVTNGFVGTVAGVATGVVAFEAALALGLWMFLPAGLPAWTIPVAAVAATLAGAAGIAAGVGMFTIYRNTVYAGSDCVCGGDILLGVPLVAAGLTALAITLATVATTTVAALE